MNAGLDLEWSLRLTVDEKSKPQMTWVVLAVEGWGEVDKLEHKTRNWPAGSQGEKLDLNTKVIKESIDYSSPGYKNIHATIGLQRLYINTKTFSKDGFLLGLTYIFSPLAPSWLAMLRTVVNKSKAKSERDPGRETTSEAMRPCSSLLSSH